MLPPPVDMALTLAELGVKPGAAVEFSQLGPVRILAEGGIVAYLLSAEHYEILRDAVGQVALADLMRQGQVQETAVADGDEPYDLVGDSLGKYGDVAQSA